MAYVGPGGVASGVESGDTRWIDMGQSNPPQVIPASARAVVMALPEAHVNGSTRTISDFCRLGMTCDDVEGAVRLVVPLEIQGTTNEYTLEFEPEGVWVRRESGFGTLTDELDCRS